MTTTETTSTCPSWCTTDHEAERAEQARIDAGTHAYITAQDPSWTGSIPVDDWIQHSRVVGEIPVRTVSGQAPLVLQLEEANDGAGPLLEIRKPDGWPEDFNSAEAAAFADLWALGRRMLDEAYGTTARRDAAMLAEQEAIDAAEPAAGPACPSWCTEPAGHGYDSVDGDLAAGLTFIRFHSTDTGPGAMAALVQEERNRTGTATLAEIEVDTGSFFVPGRALTAHQARRLTSDLVALTAQLDLIPLSQAAHAPNA